MTELQPQSIDEYAPSRDQRDEPGTDLREGKASWRDIASESWRDMKVLTPETSSARSTGRPPQLPDVQLAWADPAGAPKGVASDSAPEFRDAPYKVKVTEDGRTIEIHKDGSRVERDTASGNPLKAVDAKGNTFEYQWEKSSGLLTRGQSYLSYVSIQGPMTRGELIEIKRKTFTDGIVDAVADPTTYLSPLGGTLHDAGKGLGLLEKDPGYLVSIDGVDAPATLTIGAAASAGVGSVQVAAGAALPVQKQVDVSVGYNGELTLRQRGQTWNSTLSAARMEYIHHLDGSTTQTTTSGFFSRTRETVERGPDGKKISRTTSR